jgi:hypothetical protein
VAWARERPPPVGEVSGNVCYVISVEESRGNHFTGWASVTAVAFGNSRMRIDGSTKYAAKYAS